MADKKKALVTGATGLLGRQVLKAFTRKDWDAKGTGLSRADGFHILKADLTSDEDLAKTLDTVEYEPPLLPRGAGWRGPLTPLESTAC